MKLYSHLESTLFLKQLESVIVLETPFPASVFVIKSMATGHE